MRACKNFVANRLVAVCMRDDANLESMSRIRTERSVCTQMTSNRTFLTRWERKKKKYYIFIFTLFTFTLCALWVELRPRLLPSQKLRFAYFIFQRIFIFHFSLSLSHSYFFLTVHRESKGKINDFRLNFLFSWVASARKILSTLFHRTDDKIFKCVNV